MSHLVEVATSDGATVSIAVAEVDEGVVRASRSGRVVAQATRTLDDMVAGLRPIAETFVKQFREMTDAPDELSIQFGVTLSATADVVIASTAADANFAVTLNWNRGR